MKFHWIVTDEAMVVFIHLVLGHRRAKACSEAAKGTHGSLRYLLEDYSL